jgi:hypothetical protein
VLRHVIVGNDEAVAWVNDDTGTGSTNFAFGGKLRKIEEATKEWAVEKRVLFLGDASLDGDIDNARRNLLYQWRKGSYAL